jgi:O-antigen/teichoic acid export membrane protein
MNYFSRNLDNIIIGRFLGPVSLGYYDRAYQIMLKPLQNISNTLGQPLFAGLSSTQDNKEETTDTYCKAVFTISLITFPIMLGLSITSSEFMSSVFDPKWAPSIPVLQILSIVGAIQSVGTTVGSIYQSKGRTDIMFGVGILVMICFGCAFLLGVQWGIVGVALSYGIASGSIWVFTHWVANSLLGLSNKRFWKTLATPAMLSISMLIPVAAVKLILKHLNTPAPISLAILITTGGLAYVVLVFRSQHPNILSVKSLVVTKMECINTALCRRLADRLRI